MVRRALFCAILLCGCGHEAPSHPPAPVETTSAVVAASTAIPSAEPSATSSAAPSAAPSTAPDAGKFGEMITIPAGMFLMGTAAARGSPEEHPMHEVIVASFDLDRTEVTTRAYLGCVQNGACSRPHEDSSLCNTSKDASPGREEHPINCVDYHQAEVFCAFAGKRLPTESEWEYAARGGAEERRYSWGEEDPTPERACYMHMGTCPVATFAPGAFGLHDMSGNVWEWTASWFGDYPHEHEKGTYRVYRGGSWSRRFPKWLYTGLRNRYEPDRWSASLGIRCARTRLPLVCPEDSEVKDGVCVRAHGTPRCEAGYAWNGEMCTEGGGPSPRPTLEVPHDGPPVEDQPVTRTRTPEHDGDCQAHYKGKPNAYRFAGATFHARNKPIGAAGCTRRDMGATWTSVCCRE